MDKYGPSVIEATLKFQRRIKRLEVALDLALEAISIHVKDEVSFCEKQRIAARAMKIGVKVLYDEMGVE